MDEDKRDEEQEVRDADADTRDVGEEEKTDEEQVVRDTDADTKDLERRFDSLDEALGKALGLLEKIAAAQSVIVESAPVVDTDDDDDGVEEASEDLDALDLDMSDLD